jgi:threonine dehydratase
VFLIQESKLLPAVKTLIEQEQMAVETSAAICLAGITEINGLHGKNVAAIITGNHLQPNLLQKALSGKSLL